jgi:hypothetical protein
MTFGLAAALRLNKKGPPGGGPSTVYTAKPGVIRRPVIVIELPRF